MSHNLQEMKKDRTTHLAAMLEAGAPSEKIRKVRNRTPSLITSTQTAPLQQPHPRNHTHWLITSAKAHLSTRDPTSRPCSRQVPPLRRSARLSALNFSSASLSFSRLVLSDTKVCPEPFKLEPKQTCCFTHSCAPCDKIRKVPPMPTR